eukprot:g42623.t1
MLPREETVCLLDWKSESWMSWKMVILDSQKEHHQFLVVRQVEQGGLFVCESPAQVSIKRRALARHSLSGAPIFQCGGVWYLRDKALIVFRFPRVRQPPAAKKRRRLPQRSAQVSTRSSRGITPASLAAWRTFAHKNNRTDKINRESFRLELEVAEKTQPTPSD